MLAAIAALSHLSYCRLALQQRDQTASLALQKRNRRQCSRAALRPMPGSRHGEGLVKFLTTPEAGAAFENAA
jgi:hypothetical protein